MNNDQLTKAIFTSICAALSMHGKRSYGLQDTPEVMAKEAYDDGEAMYAEAAQRGLVPEQLT